MLLRRGVQPPATTCCRSAGALEPWDGLQHALSTLAMGVTAAADPVPGRQQRGAATSAAAAAQQHAPSSSGPDAAQAAEHATALHRLQQQMREALTRGRCGEVLRLLPRDGGASPAATRWSPQQRASLYDLALRAAADSADLEEARRLVGRMWRRGVPVGTVAHTAMLRALCSVGRHADALTYLAGVPTKRQRTHMYTLLMRACNEAGGRQRQGRRRVLAAWQGWRHGCTTGAGERDGMDAEPGACWPSERCRPSPSASPLGDVHVCVCVCVCGAGALGVARECHDMFLRRRHTPDARLAAEVVMLLGRSGEVAAAEAAWRHALGAARGEEEHACLHAARAAALARAGQLPAAVAALEAILDRFADLLPVDASFSLDSGDSGGGDGDGDQQRWREQAAHPPPVRYMQHARNAVLAAAQAAGDAAAVRRVTGLATLRGLPPDLATYHSLLRAAIAHGDGLAAVQVRRHAQGLPRRRAWAGPCRAAAVADAPAAPPPASSAMPPPPCRCRCPVQEGVEELRRLGMRPTRETYSILLRACAGERPWPGLGRPGEAWRKGRPRRPAPPQAS